MLPVKPIHRALFVTAALALIALTGCLALKPEFSHQGRLLTSSGDPVPDGNYSIVYKFYDAATAGNLLHETAAQSVPVAEGLFNINVGATENINPEIFSKPAWLEVVVNGEILAPRHRLLGAPYAFSLAPGAVVQGQKTIARTFGGYENTGAAFTVWNSDTTATGGNGLFVLNQAAASGVDRGKVAALQAIAGGGVLTDATGAYGAIIRSNAYRGMYAQGASGWYAAVFDSTVGILLTGGGTCVGCTTAYIAKNSAGTNLNEGTFVTVEGVEVDAELNVPIMLVRPASSSSDPIIGVTTGALTYTPVEDFYGAKAGGFDSVGGPAKPDGYLSVVVSGLVQVQAGSNAALESGDWITLNKGQVALAGAGQEGVARLLSAVDEDGFAWILFTGK